MIALLVFLGVSVQFLKTSLGMGWGLILSPVLLALSFEREAVVVSLLLCEFTGAVFSSAAHVWRGSVQLTVEAEEKVAAAERVPSESKQLIGVTDTSSPPPPSSVQQPDQPPIPAKRRRLSKDAMVVILLSSIASMGAAASVFVSTMSKQSKAMKVAIRLYIGAIIFAVGVFGIIAKIIIERRGRSKGNGQGVLQYRTWKVVLIGGITGFNKGISGSAAGPVVVNGLILSGRPARNAIGTAPFAEVAMTFVSSIGYLLVNLIREGGSKTLQYYSLVPPLLPGALLVIPFAACATKKIKNELLLIFVPILAIILGLFSLTQTILDVCGLWPHIGPHPHVESSSA